jgi:mxaA protein
MTRPTVATSPLGPSVTAARTSLATTRIPAAVGYAPLARTRTAVLAVHTPLVAARLTAVAHRPRIIAASVIVIASSLLACAISTSTHAASNSDASVPAAAPSAPTFAPEVSSSAATSRSATSAVVDQPRGTGYFVGDLLTQRVLLERNGQPVSPQTLPTPGRVSAWFERRSASLETDASSHHWLVVKYQILNAPSKLVTVTLPAWTLALKPATHTAGPDDLPEHPALRIPADPINVAPLSLPGSPVQVGTADLRPDHLPPLISTVPITRAIALSSAALVLTLIAWLGWIIWRNRRAVATQPFARALREMRALDDREPRAWQALHRAFDRTAGGVIQSATLPTLFERAPQLTPLRTPIEHFFAHSSQLFFASPLRATTAMPFVPQAATTTAPEPSGAAPPGSEHSRSSGSQPTSPGVAESLAAPVASEALAPRALCIELRRIERRYER